MNQKEISELKRRFRLGKNAISHICGCYVNSKKEIVSYLNEPLDRMPEEEAEKYLTLLKKALSGTLGRNLIDIVFSTQQVADSDEHRLLMALRDSKLKDSEVRQEFYQTVIDTLDMGESNYLILLAHDAYDVPHRGRDGEDRADEGDTVFSYIVCCVCPVKDGKPELGYCAGENEFHNSAPSQIVSPTELGFLFPAFDDRAANIYNVLFYTKSAGDVHQDFLDGVFRAEPPMSADEQKEAFESALTSALADSCRLEVVQAIHEQLREKIEAHRENKDPDAPSVTAGEVEDILLRQGVSEEEASAFRAQCQERFGENAVLNPENLIDSKRFQVKAGEVTVSVDPASSYLVETRMIDGRKYILIPAEESVEVNGLAVRITAEQT